MNEKCVRENINAEFQLLVKSRDILAAQDADDIDDLLQVRLICLLPPIVGLGKSEGPREIRDKEIQ